MSDKEKELVSIDDVILDDLVRIPVQSRDGLRVAYMVFKHLERSELRQYRIYANGGGNPKKANQDKADNYLIERCFKGTEGMKVPWQEKGYDSEKEYFKSDPKGRLLMDYTLPKFISDEVPDYEDIKD